MQARDLQRVNIHSVAWESAASSHVGRAADVLQRLSPGARGPLESQDAGGSADISLTATAGADRAIAAASAARHLSGLSSTATGSSAAASSRSSAAARQLALGGGQAPGVLPVGSQLPRGEEHQAERLLGQSPTSCNAAPSSLLLRQAVEDFLEVTLPC